MALVQTKKLDYFSNSKMVQLLGTVAIWYFVAEIDTRSIRVHPWRYPDLPEEGADLRRKMTFSSLSLQDPLKRSQLVDPTAKQKENN